MENVFNSLTIISDSSFINTLALYCFLLGGLFILVFGGVIVLDFLGIVSANIKLCILIISIGICFVVSGFFIWLNEPIEINLQIDASDINIKELVKYFNIKSITEVDGNITGYITPRPEYYTELRQLINESKVVVNG